MSGHVILFPRYCRTLMMILRLSLIFACLAFGADGYLLNVPQILLPYYISEAINFTLKVSEPPGGCFHWRSSRPEVVSVTPVYDVSVGSARDCSDSAIISAITKHSNKQSAVLFAEGKSTGVTLRCDVMVDKISSVEVVTTTREMFLEVAPEIFTVTAKNDQDDTFTTLAGLPFDWTIKSAVKGQQSLRIIPFSESAYETPTAIKNLEEKGMRGYQCLMEGVGTGSSTLSVKLKDKEYQDIPGHSITLVVVANLILVPSQDIYVPVNAILKYSVQLIKVKSIEEVKLPSEQYKLQLTDRNVAKLDRTASVVTAMRIGTTEIKLIDKHVDTPNISRMPTAFIHVTTPLSLYFSVKPKNIFVLQTNNTYEITLGLRNEEGKDIYITENMRITAEFPEDLFEILASTQNGSYYLVKTIRSGVITVQAKYHSIVLEDGSVEPVDPEIMQHQKIEIFDPIVVVPPVAAFPYHPEGKDVYTFQFLVSGGSSDFWWSINPKTIANMKETTGVIVTSRVYGEAAVLVTDRRNEIHQGHSKVVVVPPTKLHFRHGRVECPVGSLLQLTIQAFGNDPKGKGHVMFSDCRSMPLVVSTSDNAVFVNVKHEAAELPSKGCRAIVMKALKPGEVTVTVLYAANRLQATITISAYDPLQVDHRDVSLIALGSSSTVKFSGGPKPWAGYPAGYFYTLTEQKETDSSESLVDIRKGTGDHSFVAACLHTRGSVTLNLTVGNHLSQSNPEPAVEQMEIDVVLFRLCCAIPDYIKIRPQLPEFGPGIPSCPLVNEDYPVYPLHRSNDSVLLLTGYGVCVDDEQTKGKFANISSMIFDWIADPANMISAPKRGRLENVNLKDIAYTKGLGKEGEVTLKAASHGYLTTFTNHYHKFPEPIETQVKFDLVAYGSVEPTELALFNHASNKADLTVKNGSGYLHVICDHPQHRAVAFTLDSRTIRVSPLQNGVNDLIIYDLCLLRIPEQNMVSTITVAGISKIEVTGPNLVEIGQQIRLTVQVLSDKNVPVSSIYFKLMNLKFNAETEIVAWRDDSLKTDSAVFLLSGRNVGHTNIIVTAIQADGHKVNSQHHSVQVFAPLSIDPAHVYLLTESVFQLELTGGPQPRHDVQYTINDTSIAKVESNGMIRSLTKLGHAQIVGRLVFDDNHVQRMKFENSEASVFLHVIALEGVKIHVPSVKAFVGTQLPMYALGLGEGRDAFSFGGADFPLTFDWSINNPDVASIDSVFKKVLVSEVPQNAFAKRLTLLKAGHVSVTLKITSALQAKHHIWGAKSVAFTDTVTILAVEPLRNVVPAVFGGLILMSPQSSLQMKMNRPSVNYHLFYPTEISSESNRISVDKTGLLRASKSPSSAMLREDVLHEDAMKQLIDIEVLPSSYLAVTSLLELQSGKSVDLPLGFTVNLSVNFYDTIGRKFDAIEESVKLRPNRFDLVEIVHHDHEISVQLKQKGDTVLKVWTPTLTDFILISSNEVIMPSSQTIITSGDILCFQSDVTCEGQVWKSTDKNKIGIDAASGIGVAGNSGALRILTQLCHPDLETFIDVTVKSPTAVRFYNPSEIPIQIKFLSNIVGLNSHAQFAVLVMATSEQTTNVHGRACNEQLRQGVDEVIHANYPFECKLEWAQKQDISPYSVFAVSAHFSKNTGTHVCDVKALPLDMFEIHSSISSTLRITARLKGNIGQPASMSIPFYPSIHVYQSEIGLDNLQNMQAPLTVSVPKDLVAVVKAVSSHNSIRVSRVSIEASVIRFSVSLYNQAAEHIQDLHIVVSNPMSEQVIRVPVKVKVYGDAPKQFYMAYESGGVLGVVQFVLDQYGTWLTVIATIMFTLLCVYFGYKYLSSKYTPMPPPIMNGMAVSNSYDKNGDASREYTRWRTYNSPMQSNGYSHRSSPDSRRSPNGSPYLWSTDTAQTSPYR